MSAAVFKTDKASDRKRALAVAGEAPRPAPMSARNEVERLLDEALAGFAMRPFGRWNLDFNPFGAFEERFHGTWPKVDVAETDKSYIVTAELPGMEEKDVEVTLADGCLTIGGEKRNERKEDDANYHLRERRFGQARRTFRVPASVAADKVEAAFDNGVLRVTLPKMRKSAAKAVPVKGGDKNKARKAKAA